MDSVKLVIVAVGGQGNLLASRILGEAAFLSGVSVRISEIHGMAQRGGIVESDIVFGDAKSAMISDGDADVLMSFEPLEALRALCKCRSLTTVVTSLSPIPPLSVTSGAGAYPHVDIIEEVIRMKTSRLISFEAVPLARAAGNIRAVNMVLLGALIYTEILPFTAKHVMEAIRGKTKKEFVDSNLKAFEMGFMEAEKIDEDYRSYEPDGVIN